ncbi:hypothetical protein HEP87_56690 [Streptomyces sp. S1D4-11]
MGANSVPPDLQLQSVTVVLEGRQHRDAQLGADRPGEREDTIAVDEPVRMGEAESRPGGGRVA